MDCSLPGSSVHGILQARILEWVAISFSRIMWTYWKILSPFPGNHRVGLQVPTFSSHGWFSPQLAPPLRGIQKSPSLKCFQEPESKKSNIIPLLLSFRKCQGFRAVANHALITLLTMHWSGGYHALILWLIIHLSSNCPCTDLVTNHALITWLSCTDHVSIMHWSRDCTWTDHVPVHALFPWLSCNDQLANHTLFT